MTPFLFIFGYLFFGMTTALLVARQEVDPETGKIKKEQYGEGPWGLILASFVIWPLFAISIVIFCAGRLLIKFIKFVVEK